MQYDNLKKIKKTNDIHTWKIIVNFDNRRIITMIDNNATNNFISKRLIKTLNLSTQFKKVSYELIVINENNLKSKKDEQIKKKQKFYQ